MYTLNCHYQVQKLIKISFFFSSVSTDYTFAMQPPSIIAASSVAAAAHGLFTKPVPHLMDQLQRITRIEVVSNHHLSQI